MKEILNKVYFGNSVEDYCWFVGWIVFSLLFQRYLSKILSKLVHRIFRKHTSEINPQQFVDLLGKPIRVFIFILFLFIASSHIHFPSEWNLAPVEKFGLKKIIHTLYQLLLGISIIRISTRLIDCLGLVLMKKAEKTESKQDDQLIPFAKDIAKVIVALFGLLVLLSTVFNINVGSLVAGLGIGGLAIAMASKETLENLLGSFTIFMDKPFTVGDMVNVNGITGVVEKVGLRSTRLRTLEKSFVTIPNKKMIDSELDNLTLRTFRRVNFNIGVTYSTSASQIKNIVTEIQKYIDEHPHTNQEGVVKFHAFGSSSLDILVNYFIDTMDWPTYLNIREEINFKIMEIVEKNNSSFAFPSTSVYIEKTKN